MSVCAEYVTNMKRIHTTSEGQFLSCALAIFYFVSLTPSRSPHGFLFIDNYQSQTPCKRIGQAGATL